MCCQGQSPETAIDSHLHHTCNSSLAPGDGLSLIIAGYNGLTHTHTHTHSHTHFNTNTRTDAKTIRQDVQASPKHLTLDIRYTPQLSINKIKLPPPPPSPLPPQKQNCST